MTWRVGKKLGRTLYIGDTVVGMVDTPELAAQIVWAMNRVPSIACEKTGSVCGSEQWLTESACHCYACESYKRRAP